MLNFVGYVVPINVIDHFLKSVEKQLSADNDQIAYYQVCSLGISIQSLESSVLRKYYELKNTHSGILVARVAAQSPASKFLHPGDIILSIDNIPVYFKHYVPFLNSLL